MAQTANADPAQMATANQSTSNVETGNDGKANNNNNSTCVVPPTLQDAIDKHNAIPGANGTRCFDIDFAGQSFIDSMVDRNAISLHHYLNGFKELMK